MTPSSADLARADLALAAAPSAADGARQLLRLGMTLFLLGLLTGAVVPLAANPRMALASHLEGVMNGMFLLLLGGVVWPRLQLGDGLRRVLFWLAVYGTFANWATTLLAALWGAGAPMMPLAGGDQTGSGVQEALIAAGLISLSVAMLAVCPVAIWGLRRGRAPEG